MSCIRITDSWTVRQMRMQINVTCIAVHTCISRYIVPPLHCSIDVCAYHTLMPLQALYMPATRHFWWWLGVRPIDKANIHKLLDSNNSVVLVPGGNTECRMMKHGQETLYLRKRLGFVRLAMNHGAPLVPAFAFGQTDTYSYAS